MALSLTCTIYNHVKMIRLYRIRKIRFYFENLVEILDQNKTFSVAASTKRYFKARFSNQDALIHI